MSSGSIAIKLFSFSFLFVHLSCASTKEEREDLSWSSVSSPVLKLYVEYPGKWEFQQKEDLKTTGDLTFYGPKGCFKAGKRCGDIVITKKYSKIRNSFSQFKKNVVGPFNQKNWEVFEVRDVKVGGFDGFLVARKAKKPKWDGSFPVGKMIYFQGPDKGVYFVAFSETHMDPEAITDISDWTLNEEFDRVVSSIKFLESEN